MATYYVTNCPDCGQQLSPHVGDPQSAPWLCTPCRLGFWTAELQQRPRSTYRGHLDFGRVADTAALRAERHSERLEAFARGTSAREDQLPIMTVTQLEHLLTRKKVHPDFMQKVVAEHGRRGVK